MDDNTIKYSHPVPPFVRYCSAIIPTMFDDSLSYYEALCALNNFIQKNIVEVINNNAAISESLQKQFVELKSYVEHYFDNLDVQEEINIKLDQMVEDGTLQEIIAEYATTKVDYFYVDGETSEADIHSAFASPKTKVIEFASGEYTLTSDLILSSNTTVNLNGATIKGSLGTEMILGYAKDSTYTGYNGVHNIQFNNGAIKLPIALMHNAGIEFNDIEFKPTPTHSIQIASCKDVVINSCTFDGIIINDSQADYLEDIQLEYASRSGQPYLDDEDSASYDNGGNFNVTIKNCVFKKGDGTTCRNYMAIGHHSAGDASNKLFNENIKIIGNTFESSWLHQVNPVGFKNCLIEDNLFNQTDQYTSNYALRFRWENEDVVVNHNKFIGGHSSIINVNMYRDSDPIEDKNLTISNNTFYSEVENTAGNIALRNWDGVIVKGNKFLKKYHKNITIIGGYNNTTTKNVVIEGNELSTDSIYASSDRQLIYIQYGQNVKVLNNDVTLKNNIPFVYIDTDNASGYTIKGNTITSNQTSGLVSVSASDSSKLDCSNIYGIAFQIFYQSSPAYAQITNGSLNHPLNAFNTILLNLHKTNSGDQIYEESIRSWGFNEKLENHRWYNFYYENTAGDKMQGRLATNSDGTISYESSGTNLTLRVMYGINL